MKIGRAHRGANQITAGASRVCPHSRSAPVRACECVRVRVWCEVHTRALIEWSVGSKGSAGSHCGLVHHRYWRQHTGRWERGVRAGWERVSTTQAIHQHTHTTTFLVHIPPIFSKATFYGRKKKVKISEKVHFTHALYAFYQELVLIL